MSRGTRAVDTVFGDPAGNSLLFADDVGYDYNNANNNGELWPLAPSPCTQGRRPQGWCDRWRSRPERSRRRLAYYCPAGNIDLCQPALPPDGQTIVAEALTTPNTGPNANFTSGQARLVKFAASAAASGATATPLTFLTPDGIEAGRPDFSPDGSQVAFSGPDGVYVVPAAGGTASRILTDASNPAWSPYTLSGGGPGPGAQQCRVPNVGDKTVAAARTALSGAHCGLGPIRKVYSRHVKRGHVISQHPRSGTVLPAGGTINVVVSKGKKPRRHHHHH